MILTLPGAWCSRILLEKRKGTKWSYSQGDKCRHAGHLSREWRLWSGTLRISSSPACSNRMCLIKRDPSSRDTLPAGNPVVSDKGIWEKEELESEIGSRKYNDEQRRVLGFRTNCNRYSSPSSLFLSCLLNTFSRIATLGQQSLYWAGAFSWA